MNNKLIRPLYIGLLAVALSVSACGGGGSIAPPSITNQPQAKEAISNGSTTFSVSVAGGIASEFQWRLNNQVVRDGVISTGSCVGMGVSGASTSTLVLSTIPLECSTSKISAQISNSSGSVSSQEAQLIVYGFTRQPTSTSATTNGNASFSVASNLPSRAAISWKLNGLSLSDGMLTNGQCAGATVSGSTGLTLSFSSLPQVCATSSVVAQFVLDGMTLTSEPSLLTVANSAVQPQDASVHAGAYTEFIAAADGIPSGGTVQWRMNGVDITEGFQSSGICAGATFTGARTGILSAVNVPLQCDGAQFSAVITDAFRAMTTPTASLTVVPGDARNGTYTTFSVSGKMHELSINASAKRYRIKMAGGTIFSGAIWLDTDLSGFPELGSILLQLPSLPSYTAPFNGGVVRIANDVLIGSHAESSNTLPVSVIGAKNFVRSPADIPTPVSMQIFGRDAPGNDSSNYSSFAATASIGSNEFRYCASSVLIELADCNSMAGGTVIAYGLGFTQEGKVTFVNKADANDSFTGYVAKMGSEIVLLRSSRSDSGDRLFRIGLQALPTLSATSLGTDTQGNWGTISTTSSVFSTNMKAALGTMPVGIYNRFSVIRVTALSSGVFQYGDFSNGYFFGTQSRGMQIIMGDRNPSIAGLNGSIVFGLVP